MQGPYRARGLRYINPRYVPAKKTNEINTFATLRKHEMSDGTDIFS